MELRFENWPLVDVEELKESAGKEENTDFKMLAKMEDFKEK